MSAPTRPTFIGCATEDARLLARSLPADAVLDAPDGPDPAADPDGVGWGADGGAFAALPAWQQALADLAPAASVIVCAWGEPAAPRPLHEVDPTTWRTRVEWPTALWFTTLVAAADRCADGGSLVVVVERPATLDAPGHATTVAVADGLENLVRSLAAVHGPRGVRVNAVATTVRTVAEPLLGPPPPLATFPGRVEVEVAGAVRLLLSADAAGITGTVLDAGCGR